MSKYIFQFLILLWFWYGNAKNKGTYFCSSSVIIGIYLVSAFCSLFCPDIMEMEEPLNEMYWIPMLQFLSCIILLLLPFRAFNEEKTNVIILPDRTLLQSFTFVIIILSLFSIAYYSGTAFSLLLGGNLGEARIDMTQGTLYVEEGLMNTIASVSSSLYIFALLLYFIHKAIGSKKAICALLLLSSFSNTIAVLCYVGRDGAVFWIFSYLYFLFFFKNFLPKDEKKKMMKRFCVIISILLIPFVLISLARFSLSDMGTNGSFISYLGQGFINGPLFFGIENPPIVIGQAFPLYYEITGIKPPMGLGLLEYGDWKSWYFSTIVISLIRSLSFYGFFIVLFIYILIFYNTFKRGLYSIDFYKLFILILFFQVISEGVFYFRESNRGGNLFMILALFLAIFFKHNKGRNKLYISRVN